MQELTILGQQVRAPMRQLEAFEAPEGVTSVVLETSEVTALCPVTGQPDWYTVRIEYVPSGRCVESKSLKLYLWSFRDEGHFAEALASRVCKDIEKAISPKWVTVRVTSTPRGGVAITAVASTEGSTPSLKQLPLPLEWS